MSLDTIVEKLKGIEKFIVGCFCNKMIYNVIMNHSENINNILQNQDDVKNLVTKQLYKYRIPFENWGTGRAKTLEHLVKEIIDGETTLEEESGQLIRKISINLVDVFYTTPDGQILWLIESKQIFKDGRERVRPWIPAAISEKLKADELPSDQSVARAIGEELGIFEDLRITAGKTSEEMAESPSYPGLMTKTNIYKHSVMLSVGQYNRDGYIERQTDKDTYFVWQAAEK